jgi:hypothetical protein
VWTTKRRTQRWLSILPSAGLTWESLYFLFALCLPGNYYDGAYASNSDNMSARVWFLTAVTYWSF